MADTDTPTRNSPSSRRSAAAKAEARAGDGTFKRAASGTRKPAAKASAGGKGASSGAVWGAAAAGLAVGLAANVARKLAVQAPTALSGDWDKALANEHAMTLKVFDALEGTTEQNTTRRAALLMSLKHMLAKHAMQEENVIYPALRDVGDIEAADHLNKDHGYVKQYLFDLTEMPKDSPLWLARVRRFRADIERHMHEEETQLFPALKAKLSAERNKHLTFQMNKEGLKLA